LYFSVLAEADNYRFEAGDFISCVDNNDVSGFLALINTAEQEGQIDPVQLFSLPVFNNVPLLHYICSKAGISAEFIKTLLHKGVDVDLQSEEVNVVLCNRQ